MNSILLNRLSYEKMKRKVERNQYQIYIMSLSALLFAIVPSHVIASGITNTLCMIDNMHQVSVIDQIIKLLQIPAALTTLISTTLLIIVNYNKIKQTLKKKRGKNGKKKHNR